jgi:mono/diheme cytochrome c family protein
MLRIRPKSIARILPLAFALALAGCHTDMYDQPRYEPLERSDFFDDGRASRPLIEGTIARGQLNADDAFSSGKRDGRLLEDLPDGVALNMDLLRRGQQRFNIFCINCHGAVGEGDGMIVRRGYRRPPTYHSDRLRGMPIGHFVDVMAHGFGVMPDYAEQVPAKDRWAIAAYIRVLQKSQYYQTDELPTAGAPQRENDAQQ